MKVLAREGVSDKYYKRSWRTQLCEMMIGFKIGRHVISLSQLIVVISCLTCLVAYLVFPGPFDTLSYILWPVEAPHQNAAEVSFTISGKASYPGIVNLNINVTNNDTITHDYVLLAVIGNNADGVWWGPGWYRDNLAACTDLQNVPNLWWNQALVCIGILYPGQFIQVTRRIEISSEAKIKDAMVEVRDKSNALEILARQTKLDVINVGE